MHERLDSPTLEDGTHQPHRNQRENRALWTGSQQKLGWTPQHRRRLVSCSQSQLTEQVMGLLLSEPVHSAPCAAAASVQQC
jgi:hypothetical protein